MATSGWGMDITIPSDADYATTSKLYFNFKIQTDGDALICGTLGEAVRGVLQNEPDAAGKSAVLRVLGSSKNKHGADTTTAPGALLTTAADAMSTAVATGNTSFGWYWGTANADDGDILRTIIVGPAYNG